jgi:hypothetical protein
MPHIERTGAIMTTLTTNNEAWGFWGTIAHHADPAQAWPIAMQAVADATGCSEAGVRDFLDSRHGRHFADDVANGLFDGHLPDDPRPASPGRMPVVRPAAASMGRRTARGRARGRASSA